MLDAAAVGFKLGFAGAAGADAAAQLRHGFAAAGEARKHVFELRELNLQLALARAGVAGKDVEDQAAAVDHLAADSLEVDRHDGDDGHAAEHAGEDD